MSRTLVAVVVLLATISLPGVAWSAVASEKPLTEVTCWLGSERYSTFADRVAPQGGSLRIESGPLVELTNLPCIARVSIVTDPPVNEISIVHCFDHAGLLVYVSKVHPIASSDSVLSWYEPDDGTGYTLVHSTAKCWIGDGMGALQSMD